MKTLSSQLSCERFDTLALGRRRATNNTGARVYEVRRPVHDHRQRGPGAVRVSVRCARAQHDEGGGGRRRHGWRLRQRLACQRRGKRGGASRSQSTAARQTTMFSRRPFTKITFFGSPVTNRAIDGVSRAVLSASSCVTSGRTRIVPRILPCT